MPPSALISPHLGGAFVHMKADICKDILRLMAEGYTSPRIAAELSLSTETIRWYRKKMLLKFDADNAVVLVRKATDSGII